MHDMTSSHLRSAYGGESMANMRYLIWAAKADTEGFPNVGRLFRAIAYAERIHATNHFQLLADLKGDHLVPGGAIFGNGSTADNLQGGIDGEMFEVDEMYPVYMDSARFQNEPKAKLSFYYALEAEKTHAGFFQRARESVLSGTDPQLGPIQVCDVCGHTLEGDAPDKCPVCNVGPEKFTTYAA